MTILDGKATAEAIKKEIAAEVAQLKLAGKKTPHLAAILVGSDGASETYVGSKVKTCHEIGFHSSLFRFSSSVSEAELLDKIRAINQDPEIDGLIVQSPLPDHISFNKVTETISPAKDVDGFNPVNSGRLMQNIPSFIAATPKGIVTLLDRILNRKIVFDDGFDLSTDSAMYCSELIYKLCLSAASVSLHVSRLRGQPFVGLDDLYCHQSATLITAHKY